VTDGTTTPSLDGFRELAREHRVIPVVRRFFADTETPVGLYRKLAGNRPGTFLFESADQGVWSRWTFVGVRAAAVLSVVDGQAQWTGDVPVGLASGGDPLEAVRQALERFHTPAATDMPPLTSGLVGYLGYDVVRRLERLPDLTVDDNPVPELTLLLATDLAAIDHKSGEVWLIANAVNYDDTDDRVDEAYADCVARLDAMTEALRQPNAVTAAAMDLDAQPEVRRRRTPPEHMAAVEAAKEQIRAGEAFQIVVAQRFETDSPADALDVYRVLRLTNPSPYLFLLRLSGFDIVGSSPEAHLRVTGQQIVLHPIAGSRPRGADPTADAAFEDELRGDPKELAEHLMLVDLGRNDVGRVSEPGSVAVTEFADVRRYSHIMHLESTVVGTLTAGQTAFDALCATFPAGTLSGAPKVRAMEIIEQLEPTRRGIYGGVVGYLDFAGNLDTAIAIRTGLLRDGIAYVQAGGGIVADSDPKAEDLETRNKAAAVLRAVAVASTMKPLS
jgi:anthranilate synthase component I